MATDNKKTRSEIEKAYVDQLYNLIDIESHTVGKLDADIAARRMAVNPDAMRAFELIQLYKLAESASHGANTLGLGIGDIVRHMH